MTDHLRDLAAYYDYCRAAQNVAARSLKCGDADGIPKGWWRGNVRYETHGHKPELRVGGVFNFRTKPRPMGDHIARYRLVLMAVSPEGYYSLVGYADSFLPANGAPIPEIDYSMLVKDDDDE